ncbi:MAG: hypothetical protein CL431_00740 [Acidimicrobiaceae bacterium]|jgi:hypothetical protein|nr:hypothetical protein [Acidimicrobiaceae bacterium]|tara:strand:+ start:84759 stop:85034 length:276 start_codon:yes stop_codon:yes gene_type:complete
MLTLTTYKFKGFPSKEETAELMGLFAEHGAAEGTISHYVFADRSGGIVIAENDSAMPGYETSLTYSEHLSMETKVMLTIEEAVPAILASLA